jgi:nucleoside-diphosphate-sugar epimerase
MKVLFIGGTGVISIACTRLAAARGVELYLLNRGRTPADLPPGVRVIMGDVANEREVEAALAGRTFDVVANFINFTPNDVERDLRLFRGKVGQYVFVSSCSVYQKPLRDYRVTESTPLANPYWQYARDKIACEQRLTDEYRAAGFPVTIVRPSLTYGDTLIPLAVNSRQRPWSVVDRMLRGKPVIVHGDGTGLWTCTHNTDFAKGFVGMLGNDRAIGHAVHITSDEVLTWDRHYRIVGELVGAEPRIVHVPSETLLAWDPQNRAGLLGDKSWSAVFDNSKVKALVPGYVATTPFREGMARSIARFRSDPKLQVADEAFDRWCDRVIEAQARAMPHAETV